MTDEYIDECIESINILIALVQKSGKSVTAIGKYLILNDVIEIVLSDVKVD